jgi:hypothetical protein
MVCHPFCFDGSPYASTGVTFDKPRLGRGHGREQHYIRWHKKNDYIGYGLIGHQAMKFVLAQLKASNVTMHCNVLYIRDIAVWNENDRRYIYAFIRSDADFFVFRSFLSMVDEIHTTDARGHLLQPIFKSF